MMPQAAPGVRFEQTEYADDTAMLRVPPIEVHISGRWQTRGEQVLTVVYRNTTRLAVSVNVDRFTLFREHESAELSQIDDFTEVNSADQDPNNDEPRSLFGGEKKTSAVPLSLDPGQTRKVEVTFSNFRSGGVADRDQHLTARIAVPGGTVPLSFVTVDG